jgi:hypothetical protein
MHHMAVRQDISVTGEKKTGAMASGLCRAHFDMHDRRSDFLNGIRNGQ